MLLALFLLCSMVASYSDITRHRIPNLLLLATALFLLTYYLFRGTLSPHLIFAVKVALSMALFQWVSAGVMGMGDAKYLVVLALLSSNPGIFFHGLTFSILLSCFGAIIYICVFRTVETSIPLALPISVGFLISQFLA